MTLNAIVDELFKAARARGGHEPHRRVPRRCDRRDGPPSRSHGGKPSPTYTAVIRADLTTLVNGRVGAGEVCEIAGIGPVPVGVVRTLLGDAVLKLVLTHGVDVRNVTSLGRGPDCCTEGCAALGAAHVLGRTLRPASTTRGRPHHWRRSTRRRDIRVSTSSTDCATSTTTRRPTTAGVSCQARASDRWCRQSIRHTRTTALPLPREPKGDSHDHVPRLRGRRLRG